MEEIPPAPTILKSKSVQKKKPAKLPKAVTRFAFPRGINSCKLSITRKGRNLAGAMREYAEPRLLPKLQARTEGRVQSSQYMSISAVIKDASVYLYAQLEHPAEFGLAEFPFARFYPVVGGRYNVSIRRLIDWARAEEYSIASVDQMFFLQAPRAKFWVRIATHKTFEEAVELLVKESMF